MDGAKLHTFVQPPRFLAGVIHPTPVVVHGCTTIPAHTHTHTHTPRTRTRCLEGVAPEGNREAWEGPFNMVCERRSHVVLLLYFRAHAFESLRELGWMCSFWLSPLLKTSGVLCIAIETRNVTNVRTTPQRLWWTSLSARWRYCFGGDALCGVVCVCER